MGRIDMYQRMRNLAKDIELTLECIKDEERLTANKLRLVDTVYDKEDLMDYRLFLKTMKRDLERVIDTLSRRGTKT